MVKSVQNILLVENQDLLTDSHIIALENSGFNLLRASSKGQAFKEIQEKGRSIHLVLMDINLEKTYDGIETAAEIQKKHDNPFIFLSLQTDADFLRKIECVNSYGCVLKNSGEAFLLSSIQTALKLYKTQKILTQKNIKIKAIIKKSHSTDEIENSVIINTFPDMLFNISKDGLIRSYYASKNSDTYLPPKMVLHKNLQEILPAKVLKQVKKSIDRAIILQEGIVIEYELFFQGEKHFFENRFIAISDNEVFLFARDISNIKQNEEVVLKAHFNQGAIGIIVTSPTKQWLKINQKACDILGYTKGELKQKTFEEIMHPEDLFKNKNQLNLMLAGEIEVYESEKRFIKKDSQICFVQLGVSCLRNEDGSVRYFILSLNDISPLKKVENALRISEAKYKIIAEYTNNWEIFLDKNQELVYMNHECERISGYTQEDYMTGHKKLPVIFFYPDMTKNFAENDISRTDLNKKNFKEYEQDLIHKNGFKKIISVLIQPVILEDNQFVGIRISIRDITERKRQEEKKLFKNTVHLKMQKFASLGALSSEVCHEIKQPLHVIRLIIDTILMRTKKRNGPAEEIDQQNFNDLNSGRVKYFV